MRKANWKQKQKQKNETRNWGSEKFDNHVFETTVAKISTNNSHDSGYRESSVIPELGIYKTSFGFAKQTEIYSSGTIEVAGPMSATWIRM